MLNDDPTPEELDESMRDAGELAEDEPGPHTLASQAAGTNATASALNDERSTFDRASTSQASSGEAGNSAQSKPSIDDLAEPAKLAFPKVTKAQMRDLSGALEINIRERIGKAWSKLTPADRKRVADVSARVIKIAIDGRKIKDTDTAKVQKQRREEAQLYAQLASIRVIAATLTRAAFDKLVSDVLTRLTAFVFATVA